MPTMRLSRLLLGAVFLVAAQSPQALSEDRKFLSPLDVNALPSAEADRRYPYGPEPSQFADLRIPKGAGPFPVVIVIHGGCWRARFATVQNSAALADALRDEGYATWNIDHRNIDQIGGGWPGTFQDVAKAVDNLRVAAQDYSLDLGRVIALGHWTGGHLALWAAGRSRLPEGSVLSSASPLALRGAVAFGGIGDLDIARGHLDKICRGDVIDQLMGGSPAAVGANYALGSPVELLPLGVPQVLINGTEDIAVPLEFAHAYAKLATEKGDTASVVVVEGAGHHEYMAPGYMTWPHIKKVVRQLLGPPTP